MIRSGILTTAVLLVATIIGFAKSPDNHAVRLNESGLDHARQLIAEGRVLNDKHGDWAAHKVSTDAKNQFILQHGFAEYARWHLGLDESHRGDSKARYKFPFGDFKNVHRCALIAVQNRARQYGYRDIENAATDLLKLVESTSANSNRRDELVSSHLSHLARN